MASHTLSALMPTQVIASGSGELQARYEYPHDGVAVWAVHIHGRAPWFEISKGDSSASGVSLRAAARVWALTGDTLISEWLDALAVLCEPTSTEGRG
jgi:hypothetical protein